ncbi:MAG: aminodeoxychorismate/anthranilate synthase component II [Bacteroidetes bacterium]|nr:aminodeoxychorismate/anthranilate synthase component II [Bacteroidota bacterium]
MSVLLIDNYDSFTYNLAQLILECGVTDLKIVKTDQLNFSQVTRFHKILISPGPGLPVDYPNLAKILKIYSGSKSILGVCLGHQAIAEFFGANLINLNEVYHGVSKKVNIRVDDYLFNQIPDGFEGGLYHSWAVSPENFPQDLILTSATDDGIIMSLSHRSYDIKGIQFHPESIMTKYGLQILRNWIEHHP